MNLIKKRDGDYELYLNNDLYPVEIVFDVVGSFSNYFSVKIEIVRKANLQNKYSKLLLKKTLGSRNISKARLVELCNELIRRQK